MISALSLLFALAPQPIDDEPAAPAPAARIAWFGTLEGALAEARVSGRPILLQSAAPQCRGVPGMW